MNNKPPRKRLSRWASISTREVAYQTVDGIEVDSSEQFELIRRRVLFEDVRLVTYHRQRGVLFPLLNGLFVLFCFAMAALVGSIGDDGWIGALVFIAIGMPSLIALVLRLIYGVDVITVFGRRSRVSIRFSFRKQRAREVYGTLCAAARNAQRVRETAPQEAPPPLPADVPMPPLG
ncbi:MAG TPA: hypothetical protein VFO89_12995 [Thermoanaerobaculia bacterium]|nr:hypothetical protein [Thermoanaerobaculia bacterium]